MQRRRLGTLEVSAIGLGCMSMSKLHEGLMSPEAGERLLRTALDAGVTHFDTAALYGFGHNERLVGPVLKSHRDRIMLASKGGMGGITGEDGVTRRVIDGRPESLRRNIEDSLRRLGAEVIDLYYLHRWDQKIPVEESVGALGEAVRRGHIRAVGLSEVSAATLRKAHREFPITAVQTEYSLWTRNAEIAVLDTCREIGAAFVAFSPLARAFLTGTLRDVTALEPKDIRRGMPRFEPEAYARNLALLPAYEALAQEAGCTPAQLALAWVLAQGEHVIAIPGTANLAHLEENMGTGRVELTAGQLQRVDALINHATVVGPRYSPECQADVDSELFPDGR